MNERDMMKKLLIPIFVGILIIFSSLSFSSLDSSNLDNAGNVNLAPSSDLDLLLTGESLIHLVNDDVTQSVNKFLIKDSVMDSDGNTYVVGNLRDAGILLDELPRVNLNDDLERSGERFSPVVAKMNSNGAWIWMYYPVPEKGDVCYGESFLEINDSYAYANSISLSADESRISFVGEFSGCYDFGSSNQIYNPDPVLNGYIATVNTSTGNLDWVLSIQHEDADVSFGGIYLTSVSHSDSLSNSDIYIAGSVQSLTIDPENSAAGDIDLVRGDDNGDAYFAVISGMGELLFQADSCSGNNLQNATAGTSCNSGGTERGVSIDVYADSVMIGVEVDSGESSVRIFNSNPVTNPPNKINPLAWSIDALTYDALSSNALDLNGESNNDEEILDSIVVDSQLTYMVKQSMSEGASLPLTIVNVDKGTTDKIFTAGSQPKFIPRGFVHGSTMGTHILASWTSVSPITLSWTNSSGHNGSINLVQGDFLIDLDDFSNPAILSLPFNPLSSYTISNDYGSQTSIFGANNQGSHIIGNVYSHDTDGDGISDSYDSNALTPGDQDLDSDTILDVNDNCPNHWNLRQVDFDDDGVGDACDNDADNDGVTNNVPIDFLGTDNCPFENSTGFDLNGDGCIDSQNSTAPDSDNDGVLDSVDNCVGDNSQDSDNDGIPNACDAYPQDWDNDGVVDSNDKCQGFDDGNDTDDDGIPLGCDDHPNDTDNDGIINQNDNCIFVSNADQANLDRDAQGDACDGDIDGDGVSNLVPLNVENSSNLDKCPYSFVSNSSDLNSNGCADDEEAEDCPICVNSNDDNTSSEDDSAPLIDPDDVTTVAVVGGGGVVGGGILALLGTKVRRAMSFVGLDDGLEALKHLPQRKKKDQGSDHYFRKGVTRQQEMSLSADKDLDDYIEDEK